MRVQDVQGIVVRFRQELCTQALGRLGQKKLHSTIEICI